jgi:Zn-dependent M28 family amino/carboxypeptidase
VAIILAENSPGEKGDVAKRVLDSRRLDDAKPIVPGERRKLFLIDATEVLPFKKLPTVRVSRQMADEILKLDGESVISLKNKIEGDLEPHSKALAGVSFTLESSVKTRLLRTPNVLGYIEGSDPELKNEVVVVGAHLDHLGKRGDYVFNGSDDNGSGSVAVLEIAQAFARNPEKPKRTVLFALWTGEEKGLLGSRHYVSRPHIPLARTVATVNLDMVSREWSKERLKGMSLMFGIEISEEELEALDVSRFLTLSYQDEDEAVRKAALGANEHVGLTLMLRKAEGMGMGAGGSDHAPFALKGIPGAFFMAGMTDDYHQPSDSIEKANGGLMEGIARLAYLTAASLADGPSQP